MLEKLLAANKGTIQIIQAQAPNVWIKVKPAIRWAIPVGSFGLWAIWPAAGDTVMGRNQEA